jgi:glc operon protein GlcG
VTFLYVIDPTVKESNLMDSALSEIAVATHAVRMSNRNFTAVLSAKCAPTCGGGMPAIFAFPGGIYGILTPSRRKSRHFGMIDLDGRIAMMPRMEQKQTIELVEKIIEAVEKRVPEYAAIEEDRKRNEGNCAICIIDDSGAARGKMFGTDKLRQRNVFRIAWTKASQVWITGIKTGEYEKLVFNGQIDDRQFGIIRPDFIGWEGGQPIAVDGNTRLSIGFSGFRGASDLELVQKAVADVLTAK